MAKHSKRRSFKRLMLKAVWLSLVSILAIIAWFASYALFWQVNKTADRELVATLLATVLLLVLFISLFILFRKSAKSLLRWTGKSLLVLTPLMVLSSLVLIAVAGISSPSNQQAQVTTQKTIAFDTANALNLLNIERTGAGAVPLSNDPILSQSATNLANDMLANNYRTFEGKDPWNFINSTGYPYNYASFFFNDVNTNEADFIKSVLANQNLKSYVNGKQFLFAGIGTAQKDENSPIVAVVYLIEPPRVSTYQTGAGYRYTSSPTTLPDADYGQARPLDLPEINPEDYGLPNSTPYQYKPPKVIYPDTDDCHINEFFC